MHPVRILAVVSLSAALAAAAPATGDPQPVAGKANAPQPANADPASGLIDLPENAAEIEAVVRGELELERPDGAQPAPATDPARHARRAAYEAVVARQQAKVQALAERLAGATGDEALALQKDIEREKIATGRLLLEVQLDFAERAGDQARVRRLQSALAAWDAPLPAGAPVDRSAPEEHTAPANPGR